MHLRWYHARPQYLKSIFTNAGVPKIAIDQVDEVCRACPVCRSWAQPTNKAKVAVRPVYDFNDELQLDLMFYKTQMNPNYLKLKNSKPYQQRHKVAKIWSKGKMVIPKGLNVSACRAQDTSKVTKTVLHVIGVATRFNAAICTKDDSKEAPAIIEALSLCWVNTHGPPRTLVYDGETSIAQTAIMGEFQTWASKCDISLEPRAPRQKAWTIERWNGLIRGSLHKFEAQLVREDINTLPGGLWEESVLSTPARIRSPRSSRRWNERSP